MITIWRSHLTSMYVSLGRGAGVCRIVMVGWRLGLTPTTNDDVRMLVCQMAGLNGWLSARRLFGKGVTPGKEVITTIVLSPSRSQ